MAALLGANPTPRPGDHTRILKVDARSRTYLLHILREYDGTTIQRKTYGQRKEGTEVGMVVVQGGGHIWPGVEPPIGFIGKSTKNIAANDLLWDFFQKHPMK